MKSKIEDELREHFGNTASGFDMDRSLPPSVVRRARRRALRTTSALVAVAVVVAAGSVAALRVHHGDSSPPVVAAHTGTTVLRLVDYVPEGTGSPDEDPSSDQALQQHVDCMRQQGFQVPDPQRTDHGWSIIMSPGSDPLSDPRWREAALVTCAIDKFSHRPLTGDLILGFSQAKIDEFMSCMHTQ